MNNTIDNIVGIDEVIQSIQNDVYEFLVDKWNVDVDAYGRVYRSIDNKNVINPVWYTGDNDYKDVYYDDRFPCVFCFIPSERQTTKDSFVFESDVRVVFMVDLSRIRSGNNKQRLDADVQYEIINFIRSISFARYKIKGIVTGVKNVFNGFDISNIKFTDMQPYHCFGLDLDMYYYINDKCD